MSNDEKVEFKSVYITPNKSPLHPMHPTLVVMVRTEEGQANRVIGECTSYWSAEILAKGVANEYNIPMEEFRQ